MDTSLTDDASAVRSVLIRVLVVPGALFGFTLLAVAVSGAANASEGSPPPDRLGLLGQIGGAAHSVLKPVEPVLGVHELHLHPAGPGSLRGDRRRG